MLWAVIVITGFAALCAGILTVILDQERVIVRELSTDEKAAWGVYRAQDALRVARMAATRFEDRRRWDMAYLNAQAIHRMRKLNIKPLEWTA